MNTSNESSKKKFFWKFVVVLEACLYIKITFFFTNFNFYKINFSTKIEKFCCLTNLQLSLLEYSSFFRCYLCSATYPYSQLNLTPTWSHPNLSGWCWWSSENYVAVWKKQATFILFYTLFFWWETSQNRLERRPRPDFYKSISMVWAFISRR